MSKVSYERHGMSKARYDELNAFARQYSEFKSRRRELLLNNRGSVEKNAVEAADLKSKIDLIDECIKIACADDHVLEPYLLKNVTEGISPIKTMPPIYRDGFYKRRWLFFIELEKRKK